MRQMARIVVAFGWSDFRLKYRGSVLGFFWSFAFPLVKFVVIFHIFRRFSPPIPQYSLYLFLGLLLWEYFSMTTTACIAAVQQKGALFQRTLFPPLLIIFSVGWMQILILACYMFIYVAVQLGMGVVPPASALYLPIILLQITLLALGIGMALAAFALRFTDIPHLWNVLLQVLFWLTPIMYVYHPRAAYSLDLLQVLDGKTDTSLWMLLDLFIRLQPLSVLIIDARRAVLYPDLLGVPSVPHIAACTVATVAIFLAGAWIFHRRSTYFAQEY